MINAGRGKHLIESDLINLLDEEWLSGALLDVFEVEPLPEEHPFWEHPKIWITPHIASITRPEDAASVIVENYQRLKRGEPILFSVNPEMGY